jgi:hypothetical protein
LVILLDNLIKFAILIKNIHLQLNRKTMEDKGSKYELIGLTTKGPFSGFRMAYAFKGEQDNLNGLYEVFGINPSKNSVAWVDCKATKVPERLFFKENEKRALLEVNFWYYEKYLDLNSDGLLDLNLDSNRDVDVWWTGESFAIFVEGENIEWLKEIYQAILNKDIAIFRTGGSVYIGADLEFRIYSKYYPKM